jgi:hypothetical protein
VSRIGIEPTRAWADVDRITSVPIIILKRPIGEPVNTASTGPGAHRGRQFGQVMRMVVPR